MKYCKHCGNAVADDAIYCTKCGSPCGKTNNPSTMQTIAEVFMILGCVASGAALIPLCWTIPMTVEYFKSVKEGRSLSTAFKVCSLIFVSLVAGILMLVEEDANN